MPLTLKVIAHRQATPERPLQMTFGSSGGTIGRHPSNDWVLSDPRSFLSSHHASISFSDGHYFIKDESLNGVYINGAEEALGRGDSAQLREGDQLVLGEYELVVSIAPEADRLGTAIDDLLSDRPVSPFQDAEPLRNWGLEPPIPGAAREPAPRLEAEPMVPGSSHPLETPLEPEPSPIYSSGNAGADNASDLDAYFNSVQAIPEDWDRDLETGPIATSTGTEAAAPAERVSRVKSDTAKPRPAAHRKPMPGGNTGQIRRRVPEPSVDRVPEPDDHEAVQALLRGMGLPKESLRGIPLPVLLERSGQLLRKSLQGTIEVLQARAELKSEFRMAQTIIRPRENNPLKFSANVDDALLRLLDYRSEAGYLPPQQAIAEAFDDIKAHQMAVLSGMQEALQAVFQRFDPGVVEQHLRNRGLLDKYISVYRKARTWELYRELYKEIADEAEDHFERFFNEAFAKAYETQIRRLKELRSEAVELASERK